MYILYSASNEIWIFNPNITQYLCKQVKDGIHKWDTCFLAVIVKQPDITIK